MGVQNNDESISPMDTRHLAVHAIALSMSTVPQRHMAVMEVVPPMEVRDMAVIPMVARCTAMVPMARSARFTMMCLMTGHIILHLYHQQNHP